VLSNARENEVRVHIDNGRHCASGVDDARDGGLCKWEIGIELQVAS